MSHFRNAVGECRFCSREYQKTRNELENELFFANYDNRPVNPGHMKLIPKRHVTSLCELTDQELAAMKTLMIEAKRMIEKEHRSQGYNIGINEGVTAGQTVFHLHIHLIPRYEGDVPDPTGGVRNIIPERGNPKNYKPKA